MSLTSELERARSIATIARQHNGLRGWHRAIQATGVLLVAAAEAGWTHDELAAVGLDSKAVTARIGVARRAYAGEHPALVIDLPLDRPPNPRAILQLPVSEREWITRREAAEFAGVHESTIRNWTAAGLLPHTQRDAYPHLLLKADVEHVLAGRRYNGRGVDHPSVAGKR